MSILCVRWVMVMGDITSTTDTEYEWMMRPGNCISALLSICKYRIRAEPRRKYKLRLMRSPQDTVLTCLAAAAGQSEFSSGAAAVTMRD